VLAARIRPVWLALTIAGASGCDALGGDVARAHEPPRSSSAGVPTPRAIAPTPAKPPTPPKRSDPPERNAAADRRERFPNEFQLTSMRGTSHAPYLEGNTKDSIQAAVREGIAYLEVDFVLTRDGSLITAHQAYVKECGTINTMLASEALGCRLGGGLRLATLESVLALPFKGLFLDLKDTREPDPERARRAVERAASAVVASGRNRDVVLMLYDTPPDSVKPITLHHLRAGIKGYPKSVEETASMVARAAELDFEMVSVNTDYVTPELLASSTQKGIWHLPWSTDPNRAAHWRALAENGAGGLIALNYELAEKQVAPHWVDARKLGSP